MMENNKIKIILSERGKELANVGAFKYRFIGNYKIVITFFISISY